MKYPGLILLQPVTPPPMPWPYDGTASMADIYKYMLDHPGGDMNEEQKILNNEAVNIGNRTAQAVVNRFNSQIIVYWQNGGPANTFGIPAPNITPPDLTACYKPAFNASSIYNPATGAWMPGEVLETKPWVLPAGTVLWVAVQ